MNSKLLIVESVLLCVSVIALLILKEWQGNVKIIKLLFSLSNISIFLLEIKKIGDSNYVLIAISMFLMMLYSYKELKQEKNEIPQIQILNTQLSERNNKVDQEIELPQQLPVIHSIHESNSSMNRDQNPPTADIKDINRQQSNNQGEKTDQQQTKQEQGMNYLGDNKRPSIQQKNNGPGVLITRQQSVAQIQPNLNVIKFQDDLGEIKFGILKTLKSVAYDQLGKEVECIFQTDRPFTKLLSTVEQTNQPRMQILYESQVENNQYVNDTLRGAMQLEDLGYGDKKIEKKISWQKIIKALILIIILKLNFVIIDNWNLHQLILIILISQRQIFQFKKLNAQQLEIKCELREMLIWITLIVLPMMSVILINLIDNGIGQCIMQISNWISLIITSKYNKSSQEQEQQQYQIFLWLFNVHFCIDNSTLFHLNVIYITHINNCFFKQFILFLKFIMNQQYLRKKLKIQSINDTPLIPKIMSTKIEQSQFMETNRKRYIKAFSPQRFHLPQIIQPQLTQMTPLRQRGKSESVREHSLGFLGPNDFVRLLQADQQLGQEFCYLNNYGNPYEWKVINYEDRKMDYFMTISGRGIIIHHSNFEEFLSIKQFENDRKLFYRLQKIEFFRNYLKQKTFVRWKKLSIKNKAQSISKELTTSYLLLDASLKRPIEEIHKYTQRIKGLVFFTPTQMSPVNQQKFIQKLKNSLSDFQQELAKNINLILKIVVDACQYSFSIFKEDQGYRQNLELIRNSQMEQKPLIIGDNSTQSMQFTMESNLRQFQQKLIKFARLIDYIQLESMITLMYNSIVNFLKVIKNANKQLKVGTTQFSWIVVEIYLQEGSIVFEPSLQGMQDIFVQTIEKAIDIIEQGIQSTRKQQELQNYGIGSSSNDLRQDLREYGRNNLKQYDYIEELGEELKFSYKQIEHYMVKIQILLDEFAKSQDQLLNSEVLKQQFQLIFEMQSEIETIENIVDIGFLRLNIQLFKLQMQTFFKNKIQIINQKVDLELRGKCTILYETIQDWHEKLKLKPQTLKQYVIHQDNYLLIKSNYEYIDQQIEEMHVYNRIYNHEQQTIPIKDVWDKIVTQYQQFQYRYYDLQNQYGLIQDKFEKEFRKLTPGFHQKVLQFCEQFENNKDINDINSISQLQGQLITLELEYEDLKQYANSLQIEKYHNEQLHEIKNKYVQFKELQIEIHKIKNQQQEWMREHFLDLNLSLIKTTYSNLLLKIENCKIFGQGQLPQIKIELVNQQKLYNVIEIIKQIKDYDQNIVAQVCKKDKQQDKNLLQLIMQICNNPVHPLFTTQYLYQLDINEQQDNLQQLLIIIQYENQTMNQLIKLEEFWKNHKLMIQKVKGTKDQYFIANLNQLSEQLDENILIINNILGQPNIDDLRKRIDLQLQNIFYLQDYINQLILLQDTQNYLTNVLSTQINQKNQSKEMKMYQQQEKQWKYLIRLFQQQKSLEIWVKDEKEKKFLKQIQQENSNCKSIIQQLNEQFDKKKYLFPRFNFLTNSQFNKVVSEVKHPAAMQQYLSLFFQNIYQFDYDQNKEAVTSLYSKENDQIPVKYCPMKGEIEDWFKTVEEGMKQGLRQILKNALKHADNYQQIMQYPIQIIYICMTITYTMMLDDILQNDEKDWNELFEFKLYEIQEQIKYLHSEKQSVKQQLRQIAIIMILNNQKYSIQEINLFKMNSDKDYFYIKQLKYIYDDENIIVNFLNNKIQYQFEFFGDQFNYHSWKQSEQSILLMNQAFQINRLPHLIGHYSKYYIITQYSQILGRYYKQIQITNNEYDFQYLLQCIYGSIQSNSLLILSGFQFIQQDDRLILYTIFNQISNALQQQLQIQDLEGRQLKLQNKHFLTLISEVHYPILSFKNIHVYQPDTIILWQALIQMLYKQETYEILLKLIQTLITVFGSDLFNFSRFNTFNQVTKTLKTIKLNDFFEVLQHHMDTEDRTLFNQIVNEYFPIRDANRYEMEQLNSLLNENNLILVYGLPNIGKSKLIQELFQLKIEQENTNQIDNALLQSTKQNHILYLELDAYDDEDLSNILQNSQQFNYYHYILNSKQKQISFRDEIFVFFNSLIYKNRNVIFESNDLSTQDPASLANFTLFYYNTNISNHQFLIQELKYINNLDLQTLLARNLINQIEQYYRLLQNFPYQLQYVLQQSAKILSIYYNEQQYSKFTQLDVDNISTYAIYILFCLILDGENKSRVINQIQMVIQERKLDQLFNQKSSYNNTILQYYFNQQELYAIQELQSHILFYGEISCNKSILAQLKSSSGLYFSRQTKSIELQEFFDEKLMTYRKDKQLCLSPPFGQVKHFIIEDVNVSNQCRYFIKHLNECNYMFDKKSNYTQKFISNMYLLGTSQEQTIQKYNQFKHFVFINTNRTPLIENIYTQIIINLTKDKVKQYLEQGYLNDGILKLKHKFKQQWHKQWCYHYLFDNNTIWYRILQPLIVINEPQQFINQFYFNVMRIIGGMMDIVDIDNLDKFIKELSFGDYMIEISIQQQKQIFDEIKKENVQNLFLHESHLQKIICIMRGWQYDQHILIQGRIGSGRNSFIRLASFIMQYEQKYNDIGLNDLLQNLDQQHHIIYVTNINENVYQFISYPNQYCFNIYQQSKVDFISQLHICILIEDMKEVNEYKRILYKTQIIRLFDWPKIFQQDVATQIINDRSIDNNLFCKIFEQSKGFIQQFLDQLYVFQKQYQQSKSENQRLIIIYQKVLNKIEEANNEFGTITNQYNKYNQDHQEVINQINIINNETSKDKLELADINQQINKINENINKGEQKIHKQQQQLNQQFQQYNKQRLQHYHIIQEFPFLQPLVMELVHLVDLPQLEQYQIEQVTLKYPSSSQQIQTIYQIAINICVYQQTLIQLQNNLHNDKVAVEEMKNKQQLRSMMIQQQEQQINIYQSKQRILADELDKITKIFEATRKCLKYLNNYSVQWQQNIFNLQQQQIQLIDINFVQSISQTYNQQIKQKQIDNLNLQCKLDYEDMQLLLNLKYQNEKNILLIIDPENLSQEYIQQFYPTALVWIFNLSNIVEIKRNYQTQQCFIIKDVIIEDLLNSQQWRSFILQFQQQQEAKIYFITHQIRHENRAQSLLRTIYYKKQDKEIESYALLHILQKENPDIFDKLIQQYDEENLTLINLGSLLDEDRPIMDPNYEQQLSLLISSQFNSIINLDVITQIQQLIDQQEQQKQYNGQFKFEIYHPLMVRFLLIYKGLQQSYIFDRRYYITMQQLLDKLIQVMDQIKGDSSERYWIISNHFTLQSMHLIEKQFRLEHHLLVKFILYTQIDLRNRTISSDQFLYIIGQQIQKDLSKYPKSITVSFIKQDQWEEIRYIMSLSPSFDDLHSQISRYPKDWQKWLDDTIQMPNEYEEKLQIFEKLIMIKAFKPRHLRRFINEYIKDRSMRHSTQIKTNKEYQSSEKQIIYVSSQLNKLVEDINIPIYRGQQELNQQYLFINLSHYPLSLQEQIIQSKYPHQIIENFEEDTLLDKTLLNCQKSFLQYNEQIRQNIKMYIPKVDGYTSELKKFTYSLCYMHFFIIQRNQLLNLNSQTYTLADLNLILKFNLPYFINTNTNSMFKIITDGIYNVPPEDILTIESIIHKHCNQQVNTENYQYLHFQTLPIGSDVWLDEMINRIPDTNDTYSIGYGHNNFTIYHQQNQQIIQQFQQLQTNNNHSNSNAILNINKTPQFKLVEPLTLIKLEQKLTRKFSFQKNDSKPFSQYYRKTALNIINKNKQNFQYIDAIDQYINIQIQKYNILIKMLSNYISINPDEYQLAYCPIELYQYLWYKPKSRLMLNNVVEMVNHNVNQLKALRDQQTRRYFDLSYLYIPQALLEYFKLQFSRKNGLNAWNLNIYTDISKCTEINHIQQQQLNDGSYLLGGLECQNCQWNMEKHKLIECGNSLSTSIPFILVSTLEGEQPQDLQIPIMDDNQILMTIELQSDLDQDTINIRKARIIIKGR
ncbi:unnamed protein product [Paramecium sonneborni]|uniref:Uncharacterized protein n=1 Tax=Paramecium sonneborni TaxID=65129 RepID=A0A8S1RC69_9CILI|nr:unnamed protein product [Paramecium sonneborni]